MLSTLALNWRCIHGKWFLAQRYDKYVHGEDISHSLYFILVGMLRLHTNYDTFI